MFDISSYDPEEHSSDSSIDSEISDMGEINLKIIPCCLEKSSTFGWPSWHLDEVTAPIDIHAKFAQNSMPWNNTQTVVTARQFFWKHVLKQVIAVGQQVRQLINETRNRLIENKMCTLFYLQQNGTLI